MTTSPRPQGFAPPKSPLLTAGVSTNSLPDAPLGLSSTSGSHRALRNRSRFARQIPKYLTALPPKWRTRRGSLPRGSSCDDSRDCRDNDRVSALTWQASRTDKSPRCRSRRTIPVSRNHHLTEQCTGHCDLLSCKNRPEPRTREGVSPK
jgi:hypothetical protein